MFRPSPLARFIIAVTLLTAGCALVAAPILAQNDPAYTTPITPFQIADNLFYVGSKDLASFLITTPNGDILINTGIEANVPMIRKSIEKLGFKITDVRILLNGQAHSDHVGGNASLLRQTHAQQMVMDGDAPVVEHGGAADFAIDHYAPSHVDRVLHDGDTVSLGGVTLVAHKTAGHTRGCTTWTMSVTQHGTPREVVIVGGVSPLDYRLVAKPGKPAQWPGIEADFEHTYTVLPTLHCDIFLGAHGGYFGMLEKLARRKSPSDESVWLDPEGYRKFVAKGEAGFRAEVAKQRHLVAQGKRLQKDIKVG
jgi:metallo-beta-lactamase class B